MKNCSKCKVRKSLSEFFSNHKAKDRRASQCKQCTKEWGQRFAAENPELVAARKREWQRANMKRRRASLLKYRTKHPDRFSAIVAQSSAKRRAAKRGATPTWANSFFISEAYRLARLRSRLMGYGWEVDHIVPLRHQLVCGLHIETNLQVIPAFANSSKGNRHWPDMP